MWLARGGRDAENTYTAEIIPHHHQSAPTPNYLFFGGRGREEGGLWLSGFLRVLWSVTSAADHTFDTKGTSDQRQLDQVIAFKFVYMAEEA